MDKPASNYSGAFAFLLALFCVKTALLIFLQPLFTADSGGYVQLADSLLEGNPEFRSLNLQSQAYFKTAYRMIGYPSLIALFKLFSASDWPYLLCLAQITLSLFASFEVFRFSRRLGLPDRWALAAMAAQSCSYGFYYDQAILTDSVFTSLFILFFCRTAPLLFDDPPKQIGKYVAAGLLPAACLLIRETMQIQILALIPLLLLSALQPPRRPRFFRSVLLLVPFLACFLCYGAWNYLRSGVFFITTGTQTSFLYPLLSIARTHPEVLNGNDRVSVTARETFRTFEFVEVWALNGNLHKQFGLTALEIAALGRQNYIQLWKDHPGLVAKHALREIPWEIMVAPFHGFETWRDLVHAARPDARLPGLRRMAERPVASWTWLEICFVGLIYVFRLAGFILSLFFLIGIPLQMIKESGTKTRILFAYWLTFILYTLLFALIHIEMRYLMPLFALSSSIGMLMLWKRLTITRISPIPG